MANSVQQDREGPLWPLGNIVVVTPGTYVPIMSLVDPTRVNAPEALTSTTSAEFTARCNQISFTAVKAGAAPPKLTNNTGNVYVVKRPLTGGGGVADVGTVIQILTPGQTWVLASASVDGNQLSPYEIYIDADTGGDAVQVSLVIA